MRRIDIYTDGSCNARTRVGGYGVYVKDEDSEIVVHQGYTDTTTARMEMRAVLHAVRLTPYTPIDAYIHSDSQFVVNAFKDGWLSRWRTAGFVGVKNASIWKTIVFEMAKRPQAHFHIRWLHGHQKDILDETVFGNTVADALADYKNQESYIKDTDDNI